MSIQKAYRYEVRRYSICIDAEPERYGISAPQLELIEFNIVSETSKGFWIGFWNEKMRWINNKSNKKFAHRTKEDALFALHVRKEGHVKHCQRRLQQAKENLCFVKSVMGMESDYADTNSIW